MEKTNNVLITGASSGIGYELAKVFAKNKYNLILISRSKDKLEQLADALKKKYNINVYVIAKDLSKTSSAKEIFDEVKAQSIQVDILVNNAGAGTAGLFHEEELEVDLNMIQLNITSLTELTKLFSREMIENKEGKILNVASTGSYHPGPFTAVYYASKAYVLSFSEAIAEELKPYNITVTALCPGATKTNFARTAGKEDTKWAMNPSKVAGIAYKGLMAKKRVVIPGIMNKVFVKLPRSIMIGFIGRYQRNLVSKRIR